MICMARIFGAPERVRWERRPQRVERSHVRPQRARHRADDVHDVGVGLHDHQLVDADAAVLADAAEVVPPQVDQHHVLGALLLVGQEALGALDVLLGRIGTRPCAGDRPLLGAATVHLDERLR